MGGSRASDPVYEIGATDGFTKVRCTSLSSGTSNPPDAEIGGRLRCRFTVSTHDRLRQQAE